MSRSLGIPVKLLHEASGHIVTIELKSGELYRGSMLECEDNWNCQLESITYTAKKSYPTFSQLLGRIISFELYSGLNLDMRNARHFKRFYQNSHIKALFVLRGRRIIMQSREKMIGLGLGPGPRPVQRVPPIQITQIKITCSTRSFRV
ncbi:hypothetical protein ACJRO7_016639 [Eucalyptus globulus]|uniref:Small nuclear ribonucleoprotein Sm D3 n=1 Tax=Eucalyptus globulus TaxID=34317 RepID=A0ABD3L8J2_EUCGL